MACGIGNNSAVYRSTAAFPIALIGYPQRVHARPPGSSIGFMSHGWNACDMYSILAQLCNSIDRVPPFLFHVLAPANARGLSVGRTSGDESGKRQVTVVTVPLLRVSPAARLSSVSSVSPIRGRCCTPQREVASSSNGPRETIPQNNHYVKKESASLVVARLHVTRGSNVKAPPTNRGVNTGRSKIMSPRPYRTLASRGRL